MLKGMVILITSSALVTEVIWQLYKMYRRSQRKVINTANGCAKQFCKDTEVNIDGEVMLFSKDSALCRPHLGHLKPCAKLDCPVRHLRRILDYLDSATDSLDVCIYFFTFSELAEAIIKANNRNVVVRMILDESMAQNDTSQLMQFYKEGIKPKFKKLDTLMHHKFVIIDNKILITGSLNWTKSAFFGNFENIIVTNDPVLVKPFIIGFESMWTFFNSTTTEDSNHNSRNSSFRSLNISTS